MKQFLKYAFRWQLSSIVLAPCIYFLPGNAILAAVVSNLVGASIFFWVDKFLIFKDKEYIKQKTIEKFGSVAPQRHVSKEVVSILNNKQLFIQFVDDNNVKSIDGVCNKD